MKRKMSAPVTAERLFWRRLWKDWLFQRKVWSLVVDWVIAIYFIVPAVGFVGYQYITWWRGAPGWLTPVPEIVLCIPFALLTFVGTVRLYIEEADQLFLIETREWLHHIKRRGAQYSLAMLVITTGAAVLLLLPIMRNGYGWSLGETVGFGLAAIAFRWLTVLIIHLIKLWLGRWAGMAISAVVSVAAAAAFLKAGAVWIQNARSIGEAWIAAVVLGLLAILLLRVRLGSRGAFEREVKQEQRSKMRFASLILLRSGVIECKPVVDLSRPLLFRASGTWYRNRTRENVLAETAVKSFLRSGRKWWVYLRFVLVGAAAIALSPFWLKGIVWAVVSGLLAHWCRMHWKERKQHDFYRLFAWTFGEQVEAERKTVAWLAVPGAVAMSLCVAASLPIWMLLPVMGLAVLLCYGLIGILILF